MGMATETVPWTRADLERLPRDGNRYEVLDGRLLVTPLASLTHQRVAFELALVLSAYLRPGDLGDVVGPGAIPFGDNELQPDVQVIPGPRRAGTWASVPVPWLVAEVLSPATRSRDLGSKLQAYRERIGVPSVWLLDYHARVIHVADSTSPLRTERAQLEWRAPGAQKSLRLELDGFFRRAIGVDAG